MDDLLLALITLKYTQSNSVCYTQDGQTIGVGRRAAEPHPLHAPGRRQGRPLAPAPPPESARAHLRPRAQARRARQRDRPLHPRGADGERKARLPRRRRRRLPWAATPSSPSATTSSARPKAASSMSPSRAQHPRRQRHRDGGQVRHGDGVSPASGCSTTEIPGRGGPVAAPRPVHLRIGRYCEVWKEFFHETTRHWAPAGASTPSSAR